MLCGKFPDKTLLFLHSFGIFLIRIDIGIVIKYCDRKILRQILQYITAAGCTTTVEQQSGYLLPLLQRADTFIQH
jgi:hypothetical protein